MGNMNQNREKRDIGLWLWPVIGLVVIAVLWILNLLVSPGGTPEAGQFGDQFGAVNALFSGLAFAGVIYALVLQRNDLRMQREEMAMQREEFEQQNFQNIFFGLMKHQQDLRASATVSRLVHRHRGSDFGYEEIKNTCSGLAAFSFVQDDVGRILASLTEDKYQPWISEDNKEVVYLNMGHPFINRCFGIQQHRWDVAQLMPKVDLVRMSYALAFLTYREGLSPYFQHLYHAMRFLKVTKDHRLKSLELLPDNERTQKSKEIDKEFQQFGRFLQASMSPSELFLCFANALNFPKALALIVEFKFVDNLDESATLGIKSGEVEGITFKNISTMLDRAMNPSEHYPPKP